LEEWGLDISNVNMKRYTASATPETYDYLISKGKSSGSYKGALSGARYMTPENLRKTLDGGAKSRINEYTSKKNFPLHDVIKGKRVEHVKMLIEYGADVNKDCEISLYQAIREESDEIVRLLLKAGANPNPPCDIPSSKETFLELAMEHRNTKVIDALIEFGAK